MGKGDTVRPRQISADEWADRFEQTFNKPKTGDSNEETRTTNQRKRCPDAGTMRLDTPNKR
jgi:hypothetical protein